MFVLFVACAETWTTPSWVLYETPDGTATGGGVRHPVPFTETFVAGTPGPAADWECAPDRDADWLDWPGGLRMRLTIDPLVLDVPATFTVTGAVPGDVVALESGSLCTLDCPPELDGACFHPAGSERFGEEVADGEGVARFVVTPDESWGGSWHVFQARVEGGRYLSQPVVDRGGTGVLFELPPELPAVLGPATVRGLPVAFGESLAWPVAPGRRARLTLTCEDPLCPGLERFVTTGGVETALPQIAEPYEGWFAGASTWSVHATDSATDYAADFELLPAEAPIAWHPDADGDGWGDALAEPTWSTTPVAGATTAVDDCDDGDAARHPWAPEVCGDGEDQDCDGEDRACGRGSAVWVEGSAGTRVSGEALAKLGGLIEGGDLDGDGAPELVMAASSGVGRAHGAIADLSDRRDRGPGEVWSWPSEYPLSDLALGDVDGDGANDLVLAPTGGGSELRAYLGPIAQGDRWESDGSLVSTSSFGPKLSIGRLVDDGDPDLALMNAGALGETVVVIGGPSAVGPSAFGVRTDTTYTPFTDPDIAVADIDGDGVDDLVTPTGCLFTGPLPGPVSCFGMSAAPSAITRAEAADVDGDGRSDVALVVGITVYLRTAPWADGALLADSAWAQVSGDGGNVQDVVFLRDDDVVRLLHVGLVRADAAVIDGPGVHELAETWLVFEGDVPALWAGDLDQDGAVDLAVGEASTPWMDRPNAGAVWVLWGG